MSNLRSKFPPLQMLVHLAAWSLLAWAVWHYLFDVLDINPIQTITQRTGRYALIFLIASLACTPLNTLFGWRNALKVRRALGLYAFMFAASHFLIFIGLDFGLDWALIQQEVTEKRYILVGLVSLMILSVLALTSFKYWMKHMGKNWKRLHRLVYLAGVLVVVHFAWAKKGDLLRLQGDILWPLIAGLVVLTLLILRIPSVRRQMSEQRMRLRGRLQAAKWKNRFTAPG